MGWRKTHWMLLPCLEEHNRSDANDNTRRLTLTARLYGRGGAVRLGRSLALPRGNFAGTTEHQLGDRATQQHPSAYANCPLRGGGLNAVDDTG